MTPEQYQTIAFNKAMYKEASNSIKELREQKNLLSIGIVRIVNVDGQPVFVSDCNRFFREKLKNAILYEYDREMARLEMYRNSLVNKNGEFIY